MKLSFYRTLLVLAVALPLAAYAQDSGFSKQFSTCMNRSDGVTFEMMECIATETKQQDVRLNKAYKGLMATLESPRKKQLQEAQRAWIKFRDTNCDFYFDPEGGSAATLNGADCFMTMTAARAQELENLAP